MRYTRYKSHLHTEVEIGMLRKLFVTITLLLLASVAHAQEDGLNLPTELYVLTNSGEVQQYGIGIAGLKTVTPEGEFVLDFGVAPDGNWLAYRTENALKLLNIYTQASEDVEGATAGIPPVRGHGDTLAWSPTGDVIVYTTETGGRAYFTGKKIFVDLTQGAFTQVIWSPSGAYLAAEAKDNVWWLFRRDGDNLILTSAIPSAVGLTWVSASQVVFAPGDGGLIRMDLAAANAQTTLLDNTWDYALPYLLPDGTLAVYGRQKGSEDIPEGSGRLLGLAPDSTAVQNLSEAVTELNGLAWAPGGNLLIAFRGGVMALVIPASGQGLTLPVSEAAAYSWGATPPESVTGLELPANGYFITESADGIKQVWRLPKDGSAPEPITQAAADVTSFEVSPNERNIAYASSGQLWLQPLNGSGEARSLVTVGADFGDIAFSLDGTRIAYAAQSSEENPGGGIWQVSAAGGEAVQLLVNGPQGQAIYAPPFYRDPQFAPNVNALLVVSAGSETTDYALLDLSTRESLGMGAFDSAMWLGDGRILGYGNGVGIGNPPATQDIAAVNTADNIHRILASLPFPVHVLSIRQMDAVKVRLVLGSYASGPAALNVVDMDATTGAITPVASGGFMVNPQLSPNGTFLAGQTHVDGGLAFRDLTTGKTVVLASPPNASNFAWGAG
jgi:WD40 repeat protein